MLLLKTLGEISKFNQKGFIHDRAAQRVATHDRKTGLYVATCKTLLDARLGGLFQTLESGGQAQPRFQTPTIDGAKFPGDCRQLVLAGLAGETRHAL